MSNETEWVLVPREPTRAMCNAAWKYGVGDEAPDPVYAYRAMLAAAPQPPAEAQAQGGGEVVAWEWEYVGNDPYPRGQTVARALHEMDPQNPPYPETWRPTRPLVYGDAPPPSAPVGVLSSGEREVIETLLDLAYVSWRLADNSEDTGGDGLTVERSDFAALEKQLNTLSDLPDDRPGYVMGEAAKARWALRRLLSSTTPPGPPVGVEAYLVERLTGTGYGRARSIVDAAFYNPTESAFWIDREAQTRHRVTPLVSALAQQPAAVAEHNVKALQADMATLEQHLANAMGEVDRLDKRAERLAEALREMLSRAPISYGCNEFHHTKADRHGPFDACLPMQRWHAALDAAGAALRDHDQEGGNP